MIHCLKNVANDMTATPAAPPRTAQFLPGNTRHEASMHFLRSLLSYLCRQRGALRFTTGAWLRGMSKDELQTLNRLLLGAVRERSSDEVRPVMNLVLSVMMAESDPGAVVAGRASLLAIGGCAPAGVSIDQAIEKVGLLAMIAHCEVGRRMGIVVDYCETITVAGPGARERRGLRSGKRDVISDEFSCSTH